MHTQEPRGRTVIYNAIPSTVFTRPKLPNLTREVFSLWRRSVYRECSYWSWADPFSRAALCFRLVRTVWSFCTPDSLQRFSQDTEPCFLPAQDTQWVTFQRTVCFNGCILSKNCYMGVKKWHYYMLSKPRDWSLGFRALPFKRKRQQELCTVFQAPQCISKYKLLLVDL